MQKTKEQHSSLLSFASRLRVDATIGEHKQQRREWRWFFLLLFFLLPLSATSDTLRVMWYNVENLFDCHDEAGKDDAEFLPDGKNRWTPYRYRQKLRAISQVIAATGDQQLPDIIGLCEVEGDSVLTDLTRRSPLRTAGYRYIVTHSPDERGVNVAFLYLPGRFRPLKQQSIAILGGDRPTRDILHIQGLVSTTDTLDLFLCHLPSRRGGARQSQPFRLLAAKVLREAIDSVRNIRSKDNIIVMGDFNDGLINTHIGKVMGVATSPVTSDNHTPCLIPLNADKHPGTYAYQGKWEVIDHILVSPTLLNSNSHLHTSKELARIATPPFLLTKDEKYGIDIPFRTYIGPRYLGGFSDHLPIVADFIKKEL